eukprot:scaffold8567_cov277-Pinguiococcus_pyrenoidosus.AAC.3
MSNASEKTSEGDAVDSALRSQLPVFLRKTYTMIDTCPAEVRLETSLPVDVRRCGRTHHVIVAPGHSELLPPQQLQLLRATAEFLWLPQDQVRRRAQYAAGGQVVGVSPRVFPAGAR